LDSDDRSGFYLGDWWVSPREGRITRGEEVVRLEPKVMDVLVYLASRPGEVVTREELELHVWHGAVVGYDAVTGTVIKLRRALQDRSRERRLILTIPKRGYQLIAPVTVPGESDRGDRYSGAAREDSARQKVPRARSRIPRITGVAVVASVSVVVLALLLGVVSSFLPQPAPQKTTAKAERPSIVVLPFENLGDDPRQERLADGMTEDLITDLARSSDLLVVESDSSSAYQEREDSAQKVAEDLDVSFVFQGSIRPVGDVVRINARLIEARTGVTTWAERYDRTKKELFAIQDEMARGVIEALGVRLTNEEQERLARRATSDLEAYAQFREGQAISKVQTEEAQKRAAEAYRRAIEIDPTYGRAYSALAYTWAHAFRRGWTDAPMEALDRALELAKNGVALDDSIPQTHWALGYVYLFRKEYEKAEEAAEQAITIAPNYADGYGLLALISNNLGKPERALEFVAKGMRLNPYYTWDYPYNAGRAYYTLGDYPNAIQQLEDAQERNPNATPIKVFLAASYVGAGRQEDAEWLAQELQMLSGAETLSHIEKTAPMANPAHKRLLLDHLREAGLPQ